MNIIIILFLFSLLSHLIYTGWKIKKDLHMMQLNSYKNDRYIRWARRNPKQIIKIRNLLPLISCVPLLFKFNVLGIVVWFSCYTFLFLTRTKKSEKKPLVFTARAKRLYTTNLILLLVSYIPLIYINIALQYPFLILSCVILVLINILTPLLMIISNYLMIPVESMIAHWYYQDARKWIKKLDSLTKIGITGSYGKTSTKYFLHELLAPRFNTLMTPESYNTTMGVTKTIRTLLKPFHQIFIAEMGAKQVGDIKELCHLVSPKIGILTALGEQHLETFKSFDNIKKTKYELIESLPIDGIAFFNMDDPNIRELSKQTKIKSIYYGLNSENLHYSVKNIETTNQGSFFTVCKYDGSETSFHTQLLGKHNILNILAAISVACELGVDLPNLAHSIKQLSPVPHRLEMKQTAQGITIIDDAFSANPIGANTALDVLNSIHANRKMMITPGIIELGNKEYEINKEFGKHAAEVCDFILLVGEKQTQPIQDGLKETNYPRERYHIANSFLEAHQYLQNIIKPNDVVLFENDLPDDYNEN